MRSRAVHFPLALLCLLLTGCAADGNTRMTEDEAGAGDGPRLYGELNTSIDYVKTR